MEASVLERESERSLLRPDPRFLMKSLVTPHSTAQTHG